MFRACATLLTPLCLFAVGCDQPVFPVLDASPGRAAAEPGRGDAGREAGTHSLPNTDSSAPPSDGSEPPQGMDAGVDGGRGQVDAGIDLPFDPCAEAPNTLAAFPPAIAYGDFDNDREHDVVIGDPSDDSGRGVACFYSGALWKSTGSLGTCRRWTQTDSASAGIAEAGDRCGTALAVGDFDGDGVDDLAIGCPGEGFKANEPEAGQLTIVFGKAGVGPDFARTQTINQSNIGRDPEAYDHFTMTLAAADFDADGISDLAMGAPNESVNTGQEIYKTGVVMVLSGKSGVGLDPATYLGIGQANFVGLNLPGEVVGRDDTHEEGDLFGSVIATANLSFRGVVRPTLLIGVPGEDKEKGVVSLLAGGTSAGLGVPTAGAVLSSRSEAGAGFGRALAVMGTDRVLVGAPFANESAGEVWVFDTKGDNWAAPTATRLLKQRRADDGPRPNDRFGYALFSTPRTLLVGTPGEDRAGREICNEGSAEHFGTDLLSKPSIATDGVTGLGVALNAFPQIGGGLVLVAGSIGHTIPFVQPLAD